MVGPPTPTAPNVPKQPAKQKDMHKIIGSFIASSSRLPLLVDCKRPHVASMSLCMIRARASRKRIDPEARRFARRKPQALRNGLGRARSHIYARKRRHTGPFLVASGFGYGP